MVGPGNAPISLVHQILTNCKKRELLLIAFRGFHALPPGEGGIEYLLNILVGAWVLCGFLIVRMHASACVCAHVRMWSWRHPAPFDRLNRGSIVQSFLSARACFQLHILHQFVTCCRLSSMCAHALVFHSKTCKLSSSMLLKHC